MASAAGLGAAARCGSPLHPSPHPHPPPHVTQDFLNYHLTGRWCASVNNASIRWHYSTQREGGWPAVLLRTLGLDTLLAKWPAEVLPLGAVVGGLTPAAAAHLGLPEGLPVAQGGADADIGMVGWGREGGRSGLLLVPACPAQSMHHAFAPLAAVQRLPHHQPLLLLPATQTVLDPGGTRCHPTRPAGTADRQQPPAPWRDQHCVSFLLQGAGPKYTLN